MGSGTACADRGAAIGGVEALGVTDGTDDGAICCVGGAPADEAAGGGLTGTGGVGGNAVVGADGADGGTGPIVAGGEPAGRSGDISKGAD
ncbi:hypothetical protein [uncultured Agrobacterium sp.]|uniref:hypothetical protein n=1 Tax=uncultured Agrobacterium sp. TaxID=157277 RepID=UPI0025F1FBAB|nr:hypothetical protein [uncultured Agrobacterium sp.]